jgi:hypothetical protein
LARFLGGFAIVISLPAVAGAEPSAADKSLATQLFKEGRNLVDQGKVSDGCRKLEESQRLDPGGGTLLNVALCHEKEGRSATAWAEFTEALGMAKKDDRRERIELAQSHITALEPTLSHLVIQVPPASDLPDLEIKRDGGVIRRAAWGSAMPVDPGDHMIEASAPGKTTWKQSVMVGAKGDNKTLSIPTLENAPVAPAAAPTAPVEAAPAPLQAHTASRSPAGWVAIGFGVAGLGVGSYFGLQAMSDQKKADDECKNDHLCVGDGYLQNQSAIKAANLSTVGFGIGIVGVGVGTVLLLTSGGSSTTRASAMTAGASVSSSGSQVTIAGRW